MSVGPLGVRIFLAFGFLACLMQAEPGVHLKLGRDGGVQLLERRDAHGTRRSANRRYFLMTFDHGIPSAAATELERQGARLVSYVPDGGYLVSAPKESNLELSGAARVLELNDKISGQIQVSSKLGKFVVEFHPDVAPQLMRRLLFEQGLMIRETPGLLSNHVLVDGTASQVASLAVWDEVAYVFPASDDLVEGRPQIACAGPIVAGLGANLTIGQYVARVGDGWDGPGRNAADIAYVLQSLSSKLPATAAQNEIERALKEWARVAKLRFFRAQDPAAERTLALLFASGEHGDGIPFDGPGRMLAHTFYPAPPNPEPIAGDLHFDNDESWQIGDDIDLYSVVLHELGHALGLAHSDRPGSVMYPYYWRLSQLTDDDVTAILDLYAPAAEDFPDPGPPPSPPLIPSSPPQPPASPLTLTVAPAAASTVAQSVQLSGTAGGGTGEVSVRWASNRGGTGLASGGRRWSVLIPLAAGENVLTLTATDAAFSQVSQVVSITRLTETSDTTRPSLTILNPAMTTLGTSADQIAVNGIAADNVGVVQVTWAVSTGAEGVANGRENWTINSIPLLRGNNVIVVRAIDAGGNIGWRAFSVTRR